MSYEEEEALFDEQIRALIARLKTDNDQEAAKLVERLRFRLEFNQSWFSTRLERLWHWAHQELSEEQKDRYFNIVANGTAEMNEPPTYAQELNIVKHRLEAAERELAALRRAAAGAAESASPPRA